MPDTLLGAGKTKINHVFYTLNYFLVFYETHMYTHSNVQTDTNIQIQCDKCSDYIL